jgi:hypothetical protein
VHFTNTDIIKIHFKITLPFLQVVSLHSVFMLELIKCSLFLLLELHVQPIIPSLSELLQLISRRM